MTTHTFRASAIFFDAVGTLIHPKPAAPAVYGEVGRRHGSRLPADEIRRRFMLAFQRQEEIDQQAAYCTSEEREVARWRQIVFEVLDDVRDRELCFQELYEHFSRPMAWRYTPDTGTVLQELARQGCVLGMASNYDKRLRSVVAGLPELASITQLVISSEVGWRKPASEFFAALQETTGLPAEQILFVGDDLVNDYEGGLAAGLQVLLFDSKARAPNGTLRITRLAELLG